MQHLTITYPMRNKTGTVMNSARLAMLPELVEAVRSTRMVNVDFYLDYGGCFIHYGGQQYEGSNVYDYMKSVAMGGHYDGIGGDSRFYRDNSRSAPNNVVCKLAELRDATDWTDITMRAPFKFSTDAYTVQGDDVTTFDI